MKRIIVEKLAIRHDQIEVAIEIIQGGTPKSKPLSRILIKSY